VQDVPVDEGFWVGIEPGRRMWVQLVGPGESPQQVRPGDVVSFRGQAVPTPPDLPARVGLTDAGGAGEVVQAGRHLEVRHVDLVVHR
jgi:hypothetical protein